MTVSRLKADSSGYNKGVAPSNAAPLLIYNYYLLFLASIDDVDTCHCEKCSEEVFPIEWLSKT